MKPDKFTYIGKTYKQERYLSQDKKFYFTVDGVDYVKVYYATSDGKAQLAYDVYHKNNYSEYPIYTLEDAVKKAYSTIKTDDEIKVHPSQLTDKTKEVKL